MHNSISKKNQELLLVQQDDNYLTKTKRLEFYDQCKKTIRKKIDVTNLGMLIF